MLRKAALAMLLLLCSLPAFSQCATATRFLVPGGDGIFADTNNWATSSGGSSGASAPISSTIACADSNSGTGTLTLNANASVGGLDMENFAGTFAFSQYQLTWSGTGPLIFGTGMAVTKAARGANSQLGIGAQLNVNGATAGVNNPSLATHTSLPPLWVSGVGGTGCAPIALSAGSGPIPNLNGKGPAPSPGQSELVCVGPTYQVVPAIAGSGACHGSVAGPSSGGTYTTAVDCTGATLIYINIAWYTIADPTECTNNAVTVSDNLSNTYVSSGTSYDNGTCNSPFYLYNPTVSSSQQFKVSGTGSILPVLNFIGVTGTFSGTLDVYNGGDNTGVTTFLFTGFGAAFAA